MSDLFDRLVDRIAYLEAQIDKMAVRMNNILREATVLSVDPDTGTAKVDAHGAKSKGSPWLQRSGSIRDWDPPTEGERVLYLSPGGDPGRGLILPGGYSKKYPQPHNKLGETMRRIGDSSDKQTGSERVITAATIRLVGNVVIEGSVVTHNGKNIGDIHVHGGIEPGPGKTETPE